MPKDNTAEENLQRSRPQSVDQPRRRRTPGACDVCKKKKIKCDSGERGGRSCTNCETGGHECTHQATTKTLGAAKSYVHNLEMRLKKMENVLTRLFPGVDLNADLEHLVAGLPVESANNSSFPSSSESPEPEISIKRNDEDEGETLEDSECVAHKLQKLQLDPSGDRFFGKSSGWKFLQTAIEIKKDYMEQVGDSRSSWNGWKRKEFWETAPWQRPKPQGAPVPDASTIQYPEPDLMSSLVDNYFNEMNLLFPLLHRPTFERQLAEGLHLKDTMFGNTVLLVCALGAKYSNDPRVFIEDANTTRSAGYKWYKQVVWGKSAFDEKPTLHELQMHVLCIFFAKSNPTHQGAWVQTGLALRMACEVGAHRRKIRKDGYRTVEDELWKRAFWVLFTTDTFTSAVSGRPCLLREEDYDQELPAECDDEFWENSDPAQRFKQPADKPSSISHFICYLRLVQTVARAMRYVYSVRKCAPLLEPSGIKSDQQAIAELDSAMNEWLDYIPDHLRWDPNSKNIQFLKQSAVLYSMYYNVQIFIHRPFIPSPRNPSASGSPSLAICTNAARSCCLILDVFSRIKAMPLPGIQSVSANAALILLVNVLNGKRLGLASNWRRDMELFQKVLDMLEVCEQRWGSAGRHRDILLELISFNGRGNCQGPEPEGLAQPSASGGDSLSQVSIRDAFGESPINLYVNDPIRFYVDTHAAHSSGVVNAGPRIGIDHPLPAYTNELGQIPVYPSPVFSQMPMAANPVLNLSKGISVGNDVFPNAVPNGDAFHLQRPAPAVSGGVYPGQVTAMNTMWFGAQSAEQNGLVMPVDEMGDQAQLTEILDMDIDDMVVWLNSNEFNLRDWDNSFVGQEGFVAMPGYPMA